MTNHTTLLENLYQEELYRIPSTTLIIVSRPWNEFAEADKSLLSKILNSVKLSLDSVQIVTASEFEVDEFMAFSPKRIISFGSPLKTGVKMYEHLILGNTSLILADAIDALDDTKKKSLWLALRQMFAIT